MNINQLQKPHRLLNPRYKIHVLTLKRSAKLSRNTYHVTGTCSAPPYRSLLSCLTENRGIDHKLSAALSPACYVTPYQLTSEHVTRPNNTLIKFLQILLTHTRTKS